MKRARVCSAFIAVILSSWLCPYIYTARAQTPAAAGDFKPAPDSLGEVAAKGRVALFVEMVAAVDLRDPGREIIARALRAEPRQNWRHSEAFVAIAKRLNEYVRKYASLTPATQVSEADYVLYFNLIELRQHWRGQYPYGELYLIKIGAREAQAQPRILWKSKKIQWAGDAAHDLIKDLKAARGEL
jgi:hypothetical protein